MKAIETKYVGPSNKRGSHIVASDGEGNRVSVPFDHSLSRYNAYKKMGWSGKIIGGSLRNNYVWVFASGDDEASSRDPRRRRASKLVRSKEKFIGEKIRTLRHEGYPPKQSVAIAYRMAGIPPRAKKRAAKRIRRRG